MEEIKIIKQTPNYSLIIGLSTETNNRCYQIINRLYEVIEIETYLLPQALKYLLDLQAGLDALLDIKEDNKKSNSITKLLA